jgi:head-tail adaptor
VAKPQYLASDFRHRLTIQTVSKVSDGQGGFTETWTDGATVWGFITTLKAYQRFQAMQLQTPATHKIIVRYNQAITTSIIPLSRNKRIDNSELSDYLYFLN